MVDESDATPAYVESLRSLAVAGAEILICVEHEEDGAVAAVRGRWPDAPILIGSARRFTVKINNAEKGFRAATRPIVALCDAGSILTPDLLARAAAPLSDTIGLVLALKAASYAETFAAEVERAYINGHGARFLFAADRLGLQVASGGVTFMKRETLERIGYGEGFTRFIADDFSVADSVRQLGLRTQLSDVMPELPLGARRWKDVWRRQVRWARTRLRLPVWPLVIWEPMICAVAAGGAGIGALALAGIDWGIIAAAAVCHIVLWLTAEKWFMAGRGLSFGGRAAFAALAREALAPVLMVTALAGRSMQWRGRDLGESWRKRDLVEGVSVKPSPSETPDAAAPDGIAHGITTVHLPQHVDSSSAASVEREVMGHLRPGGSVIVDGRSVVYMSAAGVRTFASLIHRATETGARLVFCHFSGAAADCLAVSGFAELFDVANSVEEASGRLRLAGSAAAEGRLHLPVDAG